MNQSNHSRMSAVDRRRQSPFKRLAEDHIKMQKEVDRLTGLQGFTDIRPAKMSSQLERLSRLLNRSSADRQLPAIGKHSQSNSVDRRSLDLKQHKRRPSSPNRR